MTEHGAPQVKIRRLRVGRTMSKFGRDRLGVCALGMLVLTLLVAITSRFWTPQDPYFQDLLHTRSGPSRDHLLGTDALGRDILSRLMEGAWTALGSCSVAVVIAVSGGVALGLIGGYSGGVVDALLGRVFDVFLALPPLLFAVALIGALGPGLRNAMIAIGLLLMPRFYRLTRAATLAIRHEDFVEAARASGVGPLRIMLRHVLPNAMQPLLIQISFSASIAISAEASLSFLGLGVQPPTASWGAMTKDGFDNLPLTSWMIVPSSVVIVTTILWMFLIGDALRDAAGRTFVAGRK